MHRSSLKALVTSDKDFQVSHAVFFPLPEKADTVSHPVKARKAGSVRYCVGVIVAAISSIAMYWILDLTPKATHSSSGAILQNEPTANTTTSISTVCMVTFLHPFCTAFATCRSSQVLSSSREQGAKWAKHDLAGEQRSLLPYVA